jgi:hypothetical protein
MKVEETDGDNFYFEHYHPEDLINIINTQHKIVSYMKQHKYKSLFQIQHV